MERKYNIVSNLVKIHYSGKDYIGQIKSIESDWSTSRILGENNFDFATTLNYYKVCIYEKDTFCEIDNIYINDIKEIQPYNQTN